MAEDFLEIIEAELARVLRSIDRVCMLAYHLQEQPEQVDSRFEAHRDSTVNRAIAIREAIQKAGIQLPPLRSIEEREVQEGHPREHGYSIPQIARLAGVDRNTVISWLRGLNGSISKKVDEAVRTHEPPIFTLQEARTIMRAGGLVTRPAEGAKRKREIPTDKEIRLIESAASGWLAAAIVLMSQAGLPAVALPSLSISGQMYTCITKGKERRGKAPREAQDAIQKAGLSLNSPFRDRAVKQIEDAFLYLTKKLQAEGRINARYSAHDLQHAFAIRTYRANHDVYATVTSDKN